MGKACKGISAEGLRCAVDEGRVAGSEERRGWRDKKE